MYIYIYFILIHCFLLVVYFNPGSVTKSPALVALDLSRKKDKKMNIKLPNILGTTFVIVGYLNT